MAFDRSLQDRLAILANLLRGGFSKPLRPRSQPVPQVAILPARLTAGEQWMRVVRVLEEAQSRAGGIHERQREAAAQLDAATYGLQRLREEIAPALMLSEMPAFAPRLAKPACQRTPFRRRSQPLAA